MQVEIEINDSCSVCKEKMVLNGIDTSFDKNGKKYWRRVYWCEKDDVWMNIEIPQ